MFGLSKDTIYAIHAVFGKYAEIIKVIIYGSRAKGSYREGSDIDLTLMGKNLNTDHLYRIKTAIDDLNTPYLFDISIYHQLDSKPLRQHILTGLEKYFIPVNKVLTDYSVKIIDSRPSRSLSVA